MSNTLKHNLQSKGYIFPDKTYETPNARSKQICTYHILIPIAFHIEFDNRITYK